MQLIGKPDRRGIAGRVVFIVMWIVTGALMGSSSVSAYDAFPVEHLFEITAADGVPFKQPTDIAVAGGRLYVLDGLNRRVAVFDLNGKYLFKFGGDFRRPIGLCTDRRGMVYVTDAESAKVKVFSPEGGMLSEFVVSPIGKNERTDLTDCAVSPRDEIFLVDNDNHHIHVYDRGGRRLRWWGGFGENPGEFRYPATVAVDEASVVYVVDVINTAVKSFSPAGEPLVSFGGWGITPGKLFRPKGVMVVGNHVYVSDSYTGAVQVFDTNGLFQGIMKQGSGGKLRFVTPTNMAVAGSVFFVVEQLKNRVSAWRMSGRRE